MTQAMRRWGMNDETSSKVNLINRRLQFRQCLGNFRFSVN